MIQNTYKDCLIRAAPGLHDKIFSLVRDCLHSGEVIDLGAGQGALAERLSDAGYQVTAVDVNVEDFKSKNCFRHLVLDFNNKGQVEKFESEHRGRYDIALGIEVIEHVENPWNYVRQLVALTKKNGSVIVSTPNCSSWHSRLRFLLSGVYDEFSETSQDGHINPITPWELAMIMTRSGLSDVKIYSAGRIYEHPGILQLLFSACSFVIRPLQRGLLDGYCIVATGRVE